MKLFHCHIALAPMPWIRRRLGFDGLWAFGAQQCITVPSPRSVVVDCSPAFENEYRWYHSNALAMLKQFDILEYWKVCFVFVCFFFCF